MIDPNTDRVLITGAAGGLCATDCVRTGVTCALTDIRPVQNPTENE